MGIETKLRRTIVPRETRILAVDDMEAKRYAWEKVLRNAGFVVESAATGRQALDLIRTQPDLVILDMKLPDIDGLEVCRRIKEEPATASIPVLHVSATLIEPEHRANALESGADGYLTEPVEPEVLIASVKALLRLRRAEDVARKSAQEWRTTFDAIQDGILVLDEAGTLVRCNHAFAELAGRREDEILGRDALAFLQKELKLKLPLMDLERGRTRQTAETPWGERWIRVTVDPLPGRSGATWILSDVTERKRSEAAVQAGREELRSLAADLERRVGERTEGLQAAVKELEAFSYTIAHDLRAPLRTMHRFSEILVEEYGPRMDDAGMDYARRIRTGAERMDALISDLLEYSRVAQAQVEARSVGPSEVAEEVLSGHDWPGPAPELRVDPGMPAVVADPTLLGQILLNLCSNASKFVRPGVTPRVRVGAERQGSRVVISVTDNGIGIPPESRSRLFKVFERLGSAKNFPGTGIGLAIVRRAVERMGGDYGVESAPGEGSRFWISLPAAGDAPP